MTVKKGAQRNHCATSPCRESQSVKMAVLFVAAAQVRMIVDALGEP